MKTPIVDFVADYVLRDVIRLHMPGHKGTPLLGPEPQDITEIGGADVLSAPCGIIAESEANATALFGTQHSYYITEGSTLAIKAMLALTTRDRPKHRKARILAARNVHKAFIYAAALLDLEITWLFPSDCSHLCSCPLIPEEVAKALDSLPEPPEGVYLTSPDYLGQLADIKGIAAVCQARGVPLLVDNAHGAYLQFLSPSQHPIALGATMCCDSAHKTLPALTGAAYLHLSASAERYRPQVRETIALFASTSPSYLTLQSLDLTNRYLSDRYPERLNACIRRVEALKDLLSSHGIPVMESEPLKIVIRTSLMGYRGDTVAEHLRRNGIEAEFADGEVLVLMITPEIGQDELDALSIALKKLPVLSALPIHTPPSPDRQAPSALSVREAMLAKQTLLPVEQTLGRICASPTVSCPPAIPIVISGERITEKAIRLFQYYGINTVAVIDED